MTRPLLAVFGTYGGDFAVTTCEASCCVNPAHWWHAQSPWWQHMRSLGFSVLSDREFLWSGDIDGLDGLWHWFKPWTWFRKNTPPEHRDWYAAGWALRDYLELTKADERLCIVAHSHAGQVVGYAAALGAKIPILVTVGTPHRADMTDVLTKALPNIGFWLHVYDADFDKIGQAGELGDGTWSTDRHQPLAHANLAIKNVDHSKLLRDPSVFHFWAEQILPAAGVRFTAA